MDESHYSIDNEHVQGQVIGDHPVVIQHFHGLETTSTQPQQPKRAWNIPYRQNPYFTGREKVLQTLHERLTTTRANALTQPQAISGLGGIGKTQVAVEYAYRHRNDYHYILWVNAATREDIVKSFSELAELLNLPVKDEQDQNKVVNAVGRWFSAHDGWLAIFDNADDLHLAEEYLPAGSSGHLLITTRHQQPGAFPDCIDIDTMTRDEGMLLVLRRASLLSSDADLTQARSGDRAEAERIVEAMDGLPLALDQAAAYIQETQCSLADYLPAYQEEQARLLHRRGDSGKDHPSPVATTWSLSFTQVEHKDSIAADLLRACAFLSPDAIPEELFTGGASELGPHLAALQEHPTYLNEAVAVLRRFSLIQREREKQVISIHRLVQAVLLMEMDEPARNTWAERTVRAVNDVFPYVEFKTWSQFERYLPHALMCARNIDTYNLQFAEAARLLNQVAYYLDVRAQYEQAEPLYQRALQISEQVLGPQHPDTATSLNNLAELYRSQGKYEQAEPLFQRALALLERALGNNHPSTKIVRGNYEICVAEAEKRRESIGEP
jgi:tetratricopeptide (TPR) repeat protein